MGSLRWLRLSLVAMVATAVVALPAPAVVSAAGVVVVEWDDTAAVGEVASVRGVVPQGSTSVHTEVLTDAGWADSEVGVIDGDGGFEIPLSFAADVVGSSTYRVVVEHPDGPVLSDVFEFVRTPASTTATSSSTTTSTTSSTTTSTTTTSSTSTSTTSTTSTTTSTTIPVDVDVGRVEPFDAVTVSVSYPSSKPAGVLTSASGRVNGHVGGTASIQVLSRDGWRSSRTVTTSETGEFEVPLTFGSMTPGTYRFRIAASTPTGPVYSEQFTVTTTVGVSVSAPVPTPVGAVAVVTGRVAFANGRAITQVWTRDGWRGSQSVTTNATGDFRIPLTYGARTPGSYRYRVAAGTPLGTVYSREFVVVRTPLAVPELGDCSRYRLGKAIMVHKIAQRAWLCENGRAVSGLMPFTSGPRYEAPQGVYRVYFQRHPWWSAGGRYRLDHFTGFATGVNGGRIGFHKYVIMSESQVGTEAWRNRSGGCFRMRARDAQTLYGFADLGTVVHVLNNG